MFVRLSGALLIIISCAGFGYCLNLRNNIKIKELNNLKLCLNCLENEMCVSYKTLQEALDEALNQASTLNKYLLEKILNNKKENELPDVNIYNAKDLSVLKELHSITGCENTEMLRQNFTIIKDNLDNHISAFNDNIKNKSIMGKLAIYIGIVIVVFLM
ncbi:MAG: hypothetical protein IJN40_00690 [Clostridia bacterium]|nr:hypothetical protein [Clostridia bacterium]